MNNNKNYITPNGMKQLQDEFKELFHNERPKLVEVIAWAAGNGDRSENGDYIYGKRRLREIDKRLHFLTKRIEAAQVIDPKEVNSDKIVFGATVSFLNEDGETHTYQIVGTDEIDINNGKISWQSPVAKSLLGKTIGDFIIIKTPKGDEEIEVTKVEYS